MIVSREGCEVGVSSLVLGYSNGFENGLIQYNKRTVEYMVVYGVQTIKIQTIKMIFFSAALIGFPRVRACGLKG